MPTEFVYVAFWGTGETLKNGEVLDKPVIVHCMLTEEVRGQDYTLDFDHQVTPTRVMMHLIVPPFLPGEDDHFRRKDVKTSYMLPSGQEMNFWHIMFSNLEISAERQAVPAGLASLPGAASDGERSGR
jgi:hypothetical protein